MQGEIEHFFLATYWDSMEAVKAFAREDVLLAVSFPEDKQFGLVSDPRMLHHEAAEVRAI